MSRLHLVPNRLHVFLAPILALLLVHVSGAGVGRAAFSSHHKNLRSHKPPIRAHAATKLGASGAQLLKDHGEEEVEQQMKWRGVKLAALAGASTGIGGFVVVFFPHGPPAALMAFGLSLAAGAMMTISSMLLVTAGHGIWWYYAMFFVGMALTYFLIVIANYMEDKSAHDVIETTSPLTEKQTSAHNAWRLAVLLVLSLTLHNFPEGMAVGISSLKGRAETITLGIAVHNIPEGIVIAIAVYAATQSQWKATLLAFLSGIPEPLGALISCFALRNVEDIESIDFLQMLVAGIMVYISVMELLPEARMTGKFLWMCVGFFFGFLIMAATEVALKV